MSTVKIATFYKFAKLCEMPGASADQNTVSGTTAWSQTPTAQPCHPSQASSSQLCHPGQASEACAEPGSPHPLEPMQKLLKNLCDNKQIKGTILIAPEGINATICGLPNCIDQVLSEIQQPDLIGDLNIKYSFADFFPFEKMKVKIKKEIVRLDSPETNSHSNTGYHVSPEEWNEFISRDDVMVVDTRNEYEFQLGTFKGSINPHTSHFREFPQYIKDNLSATQKTKIAMFCTGGVRCEKASAYLKEKGFPEIYQLDGGILNYFDKVDEKDSTWEGKCFVFDDRICVDQNLQANGTLEDLQRVGKS